MELGAFQAWARAEDESTDWGLLPLPLLLARLLEEVGELAQSINGLYPADDEEGRARERENAGHELADSLWYLAKIANRLDVSLAKEAEALVQRSASWPRARYQEDLRRLLRASDDDLAAARRWLEGQH